MHKFHWAVIRTQYLMQLKVLLSTANTVHFLRGLGTMQKSNTAWCVALGPFVSVTRSAIYEQRALCLARVAICFWSGNLHTAPAAAYV